MNYPTATHAVDLSIEAGAQLSWAEPISGRAQSVGRVFLWTPLAASTAELALSVGRYLDLVFGLRFEVRVPREVETETFFANPTGFRTLHWDLGGFFFGPTFAVRSRIW